MIRIVVLLVAFVSPLASIAQPQVLVVDLGDAYTRSTALAGLLADVDQELKHLADRHRPELLTLRREIAVLKKQGGDTRERQLAAARRIQAIDAAAEQEEELLAQANQTAIARVNSEIAAIKRELVTEAGATTVIDVQETLYVRTGCPCDYTVQLYERLNARLPQVTMVLSRKPASGG